MDIKYLKTFKTILEAGSFQKAAEQLNYAQSTVTQQIQLIEQELSVKLFDKIGRRMELSQAGEELLPYIDSVLEAVGRMENYSKDKKELTGTLKVAMPETLLTYQMQPILKSFHEQAPNVTLSLQASNCYAIREQVMNGGIDLGIHYDVGGYGTSVIVEHLNSYHLSLIASPELNGEDADFISKGQRKTAFLMTSDRNSVYYKQFQDYLRREDIVLAGEMEVGSTEAIKRSVASRLGIAFLPSFTVEKELELGVVKELPTAMNGRLESVCIYHKNKWITPAMSLFIRILKEMPGA